MNGGDSDISLIVYRHQPAGFVETSAPAGERRRGRRVLQDRRPRLSGQPRAYAPEAAPIHSTPARRSSNGRDGPVRALSDRTDFRRQAVAPFCDRRATFPGIGARPIARQCDSDEPVGVGDFRVGRQRIQAIPIHSIAGGDTIGVHFSISGDHFLAYADHMLPSVIYRWSGSVFEPFQTLAGPGGRAFLFFGRTARPFWPSRRSWENAGLSLEWCGLHRAPDSERSGRPGGCLSRIQGRALCDSGQFHYRHAG